MACTPQGVYGFDRTWPCNELIIVRLSPEDSANYQDELDEAVGIWRDALSGLPSVPNVSSTGSGTTDWIIDMQFTPGTSSFCGLNQSGTTTTVIYSLSSANCTGAPPGSLVSVLVHELVHTLGFSNGLESKGEEGYSDHCALYLDPNGSVNGTVCQHELELLLSKYGERSVITEESFWSKHVITGIRTSPDAVDVQVGNSESVTATQILAARSQRLSRAIEGEVVSWTSNNTQVATVIGSGLTRTVTGEGPGSATLKLSTTSALHADELYGEMFRRNGTSVSVTVTGSSGGGGVFTVTDIDGPPKPITAEGSYQFDARTVNEQYGILDHYWVFDFSKPGIPTYTTTDDSPSVVVPDGSYAIDVLVDVTDLTGASASRTEVWTVCTGSGGGGGGGGGDLLRRDLGEPPGGSIVPQAVEGC